MSWSKTVGPSAGPGLVEEIDAIDITQGNVPGDFPEVEEQIALGKKLAKQAVESGAVGPFDDGTEFTITVAGHANPRHNPHGDGASSADGISIRVEQVSAPVLPEPDAAVKEPDTVPQPGEGAGDGSGDE